MSRVIWLIKTQDRLEEILSDTCCRVWHQDSDPEPRQGAVSTGLKCKEDAYRLLVRRLEKKLVATFPKADCIVVLDCLPGYTAHKGSLVLRVEVTGGEADDIIRKAPKGPEAPKIKPDHLAHPRAYIVKIADPEGMSEEHRRRKDPRYGLGRELSGWMECERRGNERGRIFLHLKPGVPTKGHETDGWFDTIKYEDAHQVLRAVNLVTLEDAVLDACRWGRPPPESVDDVIVQIFYEMSDRFYKRSWAQKAGSTASLAFWRKRSLPGATAWLNRDTQPGQCREAALRVLSSREDGFIDPCNYLDEVWDTPAHIPELQRGCAHGDLHGRNVLVGMVDGEAKWPAIYDYEDMGCDNYLGWDFVKLEMELKVRALRTIYAGDEKAFVRMVYEFESALDRETESRNNSGLWDRERLVDTELFAMGSIWERTNPSRAQEHDKPVGGSDGKDTYSASMNLCEKRLWIECGRRNEEGIKSLRLILLGIRRMARMCMETHRGRNRRWLDEYYFILSCYAVYAGRFTTYQRREFLAAHVTAGVDAYRFAWSRGLQKRLSDLAESDAKRAIEDGRVEMPKASCDSPTPDVEMVYARQFARSTREPFIRMAVEMLKRMHGEHPHLVDVACELVLAELELAAASKDEAESKTAMTEAERLCNRFEILYHGKQLELFSRFGRLWKDHGDRNLELHDKTIAPQAESCYRLALKYYEHAYRIMKETPDRYYPGINAATCYWLIGERRHARLIAKEVLKLVVKLPRNGEDGGWLTATEGEARLLLGELVKAQRCYRLAARHPQCTPHGRECMKKQVNRILRRPPMRGVKPGAWDEIF